MLKHDQVSRHEIVRDITAAVEKLERQITGDPQHATLIAAVELCEIYRKVTGKDAQL